MAGRPTMLSERVDVVRRKSANMKPVSRNCLLLLLLCAGTLSVAACGSTTMEKPLSIQAPGVGTEPALSENPPSPTETADARTVADNTRCHVCHINYQDEELAVVHARASIGCETCHGPSNAHCSDENHLTAPDIMYPLAKINSFCMECHTRDTIDIMPHQPILDGTAGEGTKHCTDCHGSHRLARRTRKWDKETGKLQ